MAAPWLGGGRAGGGGGFCEEVVDEEEEEKAGAGDEDEDKAVQGRLLQAQQLPTRLHLRWPVGSSTWSSLKSPRLEGRRPSETWRACENWGLSRK